MNPGLFLFFLLVLALVVHYATLRATSLARDQEGASSYWPHWLSLALVLAALIWLLFRVRQILLPFALGGAIAYTLNPVIDRLERRGWSRRRGILLVFTCFLLLFLVLALSLIPRIASEVRALVANYASYSARAQEVTVNLISWAEEHGLRWGVLPADVRSAFEKAGSAIRDFILGFLRHAIGFLGQAFSLLFLLILTPLVTFWLLREYHAFGRQLLVFVPRRQRKAVIAVAGEVNHLVGSYFFGMGIICLLMAGVAMTTLLAFRVSYGLLFGLLIGIGQAIPYVGIPASLALTLISAAALDQKPVLPDLAVIAAIIFLVNQLFDAVITPRLIGQRVGLHPLVVIFALLAGGELFGLPGAVIAIPVAAAIKVVLRRFVPELFRPVSAPAAAPAPAETAEKDLS
jgi:predicted PurR-regulated permease PerM